MNRNRTEETMNSAIDTARKHLAAARTIERNQRLGRYQGRNAESTTLTWQRHIEQADEAMTGMPRHLENAIRDEHALAARISEDKDVNGRRPGSRPELTRRLRTARTVIKTAERAAREQAYREAS